jgi:hypothetical protein
MNDLFQKAKSPRTFGERKDKLKTQILFMLEHFPETRDCDIELTRSIWKEYYKHLLNWDEEKCLFLVQLNRLDLLPREDNVKRIRAKIQNEEHRYLPRTPEVRKKRGITEDEWREYLNYPPKRND